MERLEVQPVDGDLVRSALDLMAAYSLPFWDAAIVAASNAIDGGSQWLQLQFGTLMNR